MSEYVSDCTTEANLGQKNQTDEDRVYCSWQVPVRKAAKKRGLLRGRGGVAGLPQYLEERKQVHFLQAHNQGWRQLFLTVY